MRNYLNYCLLALLLIVFGCRKDRETSWNTQAKGPIAKSSLSIENLLGTDLLVSNPDSSLKLIFNQEFNPLNVDSLFDFRDTILTFGASLQSLDLGDITIEQTVTLEEVAAGDPAFSFFVNTFHEQNANVPDFDFTDGYQFEIENSALFESMLLESAKLKITIENNLPLDIEDVEIEMRNAPEFGGELIYSNTFASIPANSVVIDSSLIIDQLVMSKLEGNLLSLKIVGANNVPINKFDDITARIELLDVKPEEATAIWPAQNLIDTVSINFFTQPGQQTPFKVKEMMVKQGEVIIEAFSSLEDTLYITYVIPNLSSDENSYEPFEINAVIPPAQGDEFGRIETTISFEDFFFKLNGFGIENDALIDFNKNGSTNELDTINTFLQSIQARIQFTGEMKTLRKSDTLFIKAGIQSVLPEVAYGYMGEQERTIGPEKIDIDIFNKVKSGRLKLEDVKMDLSITNGLGAEVEADIKEIRAINKSGNSVVLSGSEISTPIDVNSSTENLGGTPPVNNTVKNIILNEGNSNINEFVEVLPNSIDYEIDFTLNKGLGDIPTQQIVNNPPNFAYYDHWLTGNINMEVPLSFIADSLLLSDTIPFAFTYNEDENFNQGKFALIVDNDFPFDAEVTLLLVNQNGNIIDTLFNEGLIERALVNPSTGITLESKRSFIVFDVDQNRLANMGNAYNIIAMVGFHTDDINSPSATQKKLFSFYKFNLTLTTDLNYTLRN